ncbi:MAG: hypothetical protein E6I76_20730 [Chloroflexi bacterium]|nr:MAG: hypothetical protein E6I76_20730 [Chloroflexota bacterium]
MEDDVVEHDPLDEAGAAATARHPEPGEYVGGDAEAVGGALEPAVVAKPAEERAAGADQLGDAGAHRPVEGRELERGRHLV